MEFKKVADEIIFEHTVLRDNACDNIVETAKDIIDQLNTIVLHARKEKNTKPIFKITGLVGDVDSVVNKTERLYRYVTELEKEHYLLYEMYDKEKDIEFWENRKPREDRKSRNKDIDIQEQSSYNDVKG